MSKPDEATRRALGLSEPHPRSNHQPASAYKVDVASAFLEAQIAKGLHPSKGEILAAVQRAFGPQVGISDAEVVKARALAIFHPIMDARLAACQAEIEDLKRQLADAQQALTTQTGPTILSLIDAGCVVRIEPPAGEDS